ncbi:MAG: DUF2911 domain-containing protein [Deltaproteobacteria bacterium]|nr:DUF2911 domain-containing protein [Deltaproteobacteria bacterium]MCB9786698.1 DUF2911 domain-containing protein [Deltaproteobacteria bacterium]
MNAALCLALSAVTAPALAADDPLPLPALSPLARVMQTVGVSEATVEYSSPAMRGRAIFGGLLPYGELWRTGANSATKLTLSQDAKVAGKDVPAGTYAIFTIPQKDQWTFILNKNPDQGGTGQYDEKLDQLRVKVKPEKAPKRERLTFLFSDTTEDSTRLDLVWGETRVSVPITFDTAKLSQSNIDSFATMASRKLANAARHVADNGKDLDAALQYIDMSLGVQQTWFNTWIKADLLARKGKYAEAYPLAEKAYAMGDKDGPGFFWRDQVKKALEDWKSKK